LPVRPWRCVNSTSPTAVAYSRILVPVGQAAVATGLSDPPPEIEHVLSEFDDAGQIGAPAGQHETAGDPIKEALLVQALPDHPEDLGHSRLDHLAHLGPGRLNRWSAAHPRYDHRLSILDQRLVGTPGLTLDLLADSVDVLSMIERSPVT
jgi:hypothetical protein